jgi:hypothetical protein
MADSLIRCVSMIDHSAFFLNKLWLPSSIKFISSESISEHQSFQSIAIETVLKLERIEAKSFEEANLELIKIPVSIAFFFFFFFFFGCGVFWWVQITLHDYILIRVKIITK